VLQDDVVRFFINETDGVSYHITHTFECLWCRHRATKPLKRLQKVEE